MQGAWEWQRRHTSPASTPEARWGHAVAALGDGRTVIMYGGENGSAHFCDAWAFNAAQGCWNELALRGNCPSALSGHSMTCVGLERVMIYGGRGEDHSPCRQLFSITWLGDSHEAVRNRCAWKAQLMARCTALWA